MAKDSLVSSHVTVVYCLLAGGLALLSACTKTLDTTPIENEIRDNIIKQGGLSLKAVACPKNVPVEAGKSFECVGELESGDRFAIPAKQTDASGKVEWDVPNAKGLLNLVKLEVIFQETLKAKEGKAFAIECGKGYKPVKPGESFECQIEKPVAKPTEATKSAKADQNSKTSQKTVSLKQVKPPNPPETILVTIDPDNNVNWQQVVSVVSDKPAAAQPSSSNSASKTTAIPTSSARANLSEDTQKDVEERFD